MSAPARLLTMALAAGARPQDALRLAAGAAPSATRGALTRAAEAAEGEAPGDLLFPYELGPRAAVELLRRAPASARARVAAHLCEGLGAGRVPAWQRLEQAWLSNVDHVVGLMTAGIAAACTLSLREFVLPALAEADLSAERWRLSLSLALFGLSAAILLAHAFRHRPRGFAQVVHASLSQRDASLLFVLAAAAEAGVAMREAMAWLSPRGAADADHLEDLVAAGALSAPLAAVAARPLPDDGPGDALARAGRLAARRPAPQVPAAPILVALAMIIIGILLTTGEVFRLFVHIGGMVK